ncbi:MAG: SDR family oxidoreductase [Lachnospiraceae bacterium]|jgi:3-oxoacyl-[acyl-carrier protein] reductase|nr:SDR family oxidoreductase [Lachnospiraceae bacterium]
MGHKNIYLILGASSDIGYALLEKLNEKEEESVFLCHYHCNSEKIETVLPHNNNIIEKFQADFSKLEEVRNFADKIKQKYGSPTHIVHLPAGKLQYTRFKKFEWEQFQRDLEIQIHAFIVILQMFLPLMAEKEKKSKIVIMLTSYTIANPPKHMVSYIMSKYALLGLMKALAADYAGKQICINGISPSMIETKFLDGIDRRLIEQNALRSIGQRNAIPSDIVPAILFLLSEDSDYINGVNLNISNGNVM